MAFHTLEPLKVMHTNVSSESCTRQASGASVCLHLSSMFPCSLTPAPVPAGKQPFHPTVCWELCPAGCLSPIHTIERLQGVKDGQAGVCTHPGVY